MYEFLGRTFDESLVHIKFKAFGGAKSFKTIDGSIGRYDRQDCS